MGAKRNVDMSATKTKVKIVKTESKEQADAVITDKKTLDNKKKLCYQRL